MRHAPAAFVLILATWLPHAAAAQCPGKVALQVLGSGGPIADDGRASSGYLLWLNGQARLLVDTGGGVFLRFGETQAQIEDLDAIVLTHLHTDHAADLPALIKSAYFSARHRTLPIFGPTGAPRWPRTSEFIGGLFGSEHGVFRYLDGFLDGSDGFRLEPHDIDADRREPVTLIDNEHFRLRAVGVHHGPVPALGLVIETHGKRIALSGDQNDDNPAFTQLAQDADLLFMDHAIPQNTGPVERNLHATPQHIGAMAAQAGIKHLVLSHLMARSLDKLDQSKALIRASYDGPLSVAEDLACYTPD
jgi:ribonuclease BN (tRNA processing enzyme)